MVARFSSLLHCRYFTKYIGRVPRDSWATATVQREKGLATRLFYAAFPSMKRDKVISLVGFPSEQSFRMLAQRTGGFSGREISKLISSVGTYALARDEKNRASISWSECVTVVDTKVQEHLVKRSFYDDKSNHI